MSNENIYLGNPNLKKANTPVEFTEENIIEFVRCKNDPVYFAQNYVKIVSLDEGLITFKPYDFQEKLINNFHENRFNICKMPRQTGKSTTCVSYLHQLQTFRPAWNHLIQTKGNGLATIHRTVKHRAISQGAVIMHHHFISRRWRHVTITCF